MRKNSFLSLGTVLSFSIHKYSGYCFKSLVGFLFLFFFLFFFNQMLTGFLSPQLLTAVNVQSRMPQSVFEWYFYSCILVLWDLY